MCGLKILLAGSPIILLVHEIHNSRYIITSKSTSMKMRLQRRLTPILERTTVKLTHSGRWKFRDDLLTIQRRTIVTLAYLSVVMPNAVCILALEITRRELSRERLSPVPVFDKY